MDPSRIYDESSAECRASVGRIEIKLGIKGLLGRVSWPAESLCCVLEQGTLFCCLELVQPRKMGNHPNEKFLTEM